MALNPPGSLLIVVPKDLHPTEFGPDLFLEGTMQVLCHECAQDYSPELVQLVEGATASTV